MPGPVAVLAARKHLTVVCRRSILSAHTEVECGRHGAVAVPASDLRAQFLDFSGTPISPRPTRPFWCTATLPRPRNPTRSPFMRSQGGRMFPERSYQESAQSARRKPREVLSSRCVRLPFWSLDVRRRSPSGWSKKGVLPPLPIRQWSAQQGGC